MLRISHRPEWHLLKPKNAHYTKSLDLKDYRTVLELAEIAGDKHDWRKQTLQLLEKQSQPKIRGHWATSSTDKLLEFHLYHEAFEEALAIVAKEPENPDLLLKLAWKISNQPDKAFPLFQQVIESQINRTNNNAYHDAIKILREMADKMQTRQQKQKMIELLDQLRQKFCAKRNFIKWLNEAFE